MSTTLIEHFGLQLPRGGREGVRYFLTEFVGDVAARRPAQGHYYDAPEVAATDPHHVQNMKDPKAWIPFYARVQYWKNPLLRQQLYRYITAAY